MKRLLYLSLFLTTLTLSGCMTPEGYEQDTTDETGADYIGGPR